MKILLAILVFGVIVVVHEGGHFFAARLCGVKVNEFAIGMGPAIFKKQGKETLFTVRLLPLGGFCSMEGENEDSDVEGAFNTKSPSQRLLVISAGAIMNILLGFILAAVVTVVSGKIVTNEIVYFTEDAVSSTTGLQIGDKIVRINGKSILTANDIVYQLRNDVDGIIDMQVIRNSQRVDLDNVKFNLSVNTKTGKQVINIDFRVSSVKCTAANLLPHSLRKTVSTARLIWISLVDMISGKYGFNDIQGPVGIVNAIGEAAAVNVSELLDFMMLITVNVGIFNLLPLPALDGGRIAFIVAEIIRRKPVPPEREGLVHFVGFALLMVLMLAVTYNDILRIVKPSEADAEKAVYIGGMILEK